MPSDIKNQTAPPRTVILLSSPTSATGSIWRACRALAEGRYQATEPVNEFYKNQRMAELKDWAPPESGKLLLMNAPHLLNPKLDLTRYRFVLNARDPRDLACNQYHWRLVHPAPGDQPGDLEKRAEEARARGIDAFVLGQNNNHIYKALQAITARAPRESWMFLGYAMWCLRYDEALARVASFLGVDLGALSPEQQAVLARERTPDIAKNPKWVGQRWQGADTAPGRYRAELQPDTIARLTARDAKHLQWLKEVDDPSLADLYD